MTLDRTTSKVGQQYLYNKFRTIPKEAGKIGIHEVFIKEFTNNIGFRIDEQRQLC